jgi:uncharacterized membrane protein (DUF106 family)
MLSGQNPKSKIPNSKTNMTQHILSNQESALLDMLTTDLSKLNDEIKEAEEAKASAMVESLSNHRREIIRQMNELLKGNNNNNFHNN